MVKGGLEQCLCAVRHWRVASLNYLFIPLGLLQLIWEFNQPALQSAADCCNLLRVLAGETQSRKPDKLLNVHSLWNI